MAATVKEVRALSAPAIYLDGKRIKIIPGSLKADLPGMVKGRAVSSGGGSVDMVYGYDVEADACKIVFEVANTAEMAELAADYSARRRTTQISTLKIVEQTAQFSYDTVLMTDKIEIPFDADGKIKLEFMGRYVGI